MLENINAGLEKENDKLKREMTRIVKSTKAMHESRETTLCEIEGIKARTEKLQSGYEKEWAAFTDIIEDDRQAQVQQLPSRTSICWCTPMASVPSACRRQSARKRWRTVSAKRRNCCIVRRIQPLEPDWVARIQNR